MENKKNDNVPMELVEDEDIKQAIMDQLDDVVDEESNVSILTPDDLIRLKREFENHDEIIAIELEDVSSSYLTIAKELYYLSKMDLKLFGYENIYDYGNAKYQFGTTSIKNMIAIVKKCCIEDFNVGLKLKSEYSDFSYSQLVELLSVEGDKLEFFDPSMTVKQIRENKVLIKLNEFFYKNIFETIKDFRKFVNDVFKAPGVCIPPGDTSEAKKEKFFEACKKLGDFKFEEVSSDINKNSLNYQYVYLCKYIYSSYKKYPIEVKLSFTLKDERILLESRYSFYINDLIWASYDVFFERFHNFKEIYSFFVKYLAALEDLDKARENEKKRKEENAKSKEKAKEKESKFKEITNKGIMKYGENKKLLNSYPEIKTLIKDRSSKINISDDDEIIVTGHYSFPNFYLKITDKYFLGLNYMSICERCNGYFGSSGSDYKTKEYYQMIIDFIKKSQTSDGKEKNEDKKD